MKQQQHRMMALSLAFLVLISTTGFSMNVMLCKCTGTEYLAMLSSGKSLDCCKTKLQESKKSLQQHDCCSKKSKKCAKKNSNKESHISSDKDCCSSNYKYAKANINFDLASDFDFPNFDLLVPSIPSYKTTFSYLVETSFPIAQQFPQNKTPPRFYGVQLLHWIQNYRC